MDSFLEFWACILHILRAFKRVTAVRCPVADDLLILILYTTARPHTH